MRPLHIALTTISCLFFSVVACDRSPRQTSPEPWPFQSAAGRYEVTMPGGWLTEATDEINPYADFAASLDDSLFIIVIPQELPVFPMPDVQAFKAASVELLRENLEEFRIERQGSIILDGHDGQSVFVKGLVLGEPIQYIATYVTRDDWGYQIIAWAPAVRERILIEQVDAILTSWRFK
jgi:hypothetical protein